MQPCMGKPCDRPCTRRPRDACLASGSQADSHGYACHTAGAADAVVELATTAAEGASTVSEAMRTSCALLERCKAALGVYVTPGSSKVERCISDHLRE